jgi:fructose/tagatose bisphosphate aldolase
LGEHFANNAEERDAPVIVAVSAVAFVFVQGDNIGVSHVLGYVTLLPAETEKVVE